MTMCELVRFTGSMSTPVASLAATVRLVQVQFMPAARLLRFRNTVLSLHPNVSEREKRVIEHDAHVSILLYANVLQILSRLLQYLSIFSSTPGRTRDANTSSSPSLFAK